MKYTYVDKATNPQVSKKNLKTQNYPETAMSIDTLYALYVLRLW